MLRLPLFKIAAILSVVAGSVLLFSAAGPTFNVHQKAYYLDEAKVNFVRPGLIIKVLSASIGADGTIKARVKLTDAKGFALDRLGVTTPGPVSCSLIAANIPKGQSQYTAYTMRTQTSPITGVSARQAGADSGGTWETTNVEGEYVYTFATRVPQNYDKTVTHSIGAYGSRNLSEFDMGTQYDDDVFNFVPDGSKVTVVRDVIRTATCNKCHDQMAFHGGSRRTMELCVLCHQPQTVDPDTGNTVDMPVMTHKIHMGSSLPSVIAGKKYQIIGNAQSVNDYSDIVFPADARNCLFCHEKGAAQADNVFKPSRVACGSCHDNVNFDTGANHVDLPQYSDNLCAGCHIPKGEIEFDASILGAHTIPRMSTMLPGVVFQLVRIDDAAPGKNPTVTFTIKDKAGNPLKASQLTRLTLYMAGPNTDITTYISEAALTALGPGDGTHYWTFARPLPANAKGSWTLAIEGRAEVKLLEGTKQETLVRDTGLNQQMAFSVDGSKPVPRRTIVTLEKCNACHANLAFHGDNRNTPGQCAICHNPTLTAGNPAVSLDFRVMVHRIHTGSELERTYKIGNTDFTEVGYPGDRRNCGGCHVNGSEQLPLDAGLVPVAEPAGPLNPMGPETAACTGCHASMTAASHALANTTATGEACASCHGTDSEFSVDKIHAR
jgi:OmcA/MtrC family decaheme c-type cytochrome